MSEDVVRIPVVATKRGFYAGRLQDPLADGGQPFVLTANEHFSARWMEKYDGAAALSPEQEADAQRRELEQLRAYKAEREAEKAAAAADTEDKPKAAKKASK